MHAVFPACVQMRCSKRASFCRSKNGPLSSSSAVYARARLTDVSLVSRAVVCTTALFAPYAQFVSAFLLARAPAEIGGKHQQILAWPSPAMFRVCRSESVQSSRVEWCAMWGREPTDQTFVITGLHHAYAHNTGFGLDEDCDEDLHNFSESLKLHVISVSQRAGGVSGGYFGPYDPHNADSCRSVLCPPASPCVDLVPTYRGGCAGVVCCVDAVRRNTLGVLLAGNVGAHTQRHVRGCILDA